MTTIGITGGIGSGKSVVADILRLHNIPVYIADEESKKLVDTSSEIKDKLSRIVNENIYTSSGLNRKLFASLIFNNPTLLAQVNNIIHPIVQESFEKWIKNQNTRICAIESAILFESGFHKIIDKKITVYSPLEVRLERVCKRDNVSAEIVMQRIKNQLPDEEKTRMSDFIIYNDNTKALIPQIDKLIATI
jgi:dephospho-CoA kinase